MSHSERYRHRRAPRRFENMRGNLQELFTGRSTVTMASRSRTPIPDSPKAPRLPLSLPRSRLVIPYLPMPRSWTPSLRSSNSTSSRRSRDSVDDIERNGGTRSHINSNQQEPDVQVPRPSQSSRHRTNRSVGVDPDEQHLYMITSRARRKKAHHRQTSTSSPRSSFTRRLFPKIKSRAMRRKTLLCIISGIALAVILTIYLALALTKSESQEFHVFLILVILCTTIWFCHCLIALCLLAVKPKSGEDGDEGNGGRMPDMSALMESHGAWNGGTGFANPQRPIPVRLARDEEAVHGESKVVGVAPPAYGLWRESVRVDPDRIFWQRNEAARLERLNSVASIASTSANSRSETRRPPSYVSNDGIGGVNDLEGSSFPPIAQLNLPPHPSEVGRVTAGLRI